MPQTTKAPSGPGTLFVVATPIGNLEDLTVRAVRILFIGFLPPKAAARRRELDALRDRRETLVFYESPVRVVKSLGDMVLALGDREAFLCREATKLHEEYVRDRLSGLGRRLEARGEGEGGILVVGAGACPPGP